MNNRIGAASKYFERVAESSESVRLNAFKNNYCLCDREFDHLLLLFKTVRVSEFGVRSKDKTAKQN